VQRFQRRHHARHIADVLVKGLAAFFAETSVLAVGVTMWTLHGIISFAEGNC